MEEEEEAAAGTGSEASFCLQKFTITDDSKDDYQYEEVPADDEFSLQEDDEDLSKALQAIQEQAEDAHILALQSVLTSEKSVSEIPEAMDDFFCNFLVRLGMSRTLNCFQTEWYELIERGVFTAEDTGLVPAAYTHNQQLEAENMRLRKDLDNYKLAANKVKEAFLKMQKERDFHRMHHRRVIQEKNRLICDIKRLKAHYASYEPVLKQLTEKYQTILRQKMLTSLERDRAVEQVTGLQATLRSLESGCAMQIPVTKGHEIKRKKRLEGPTQKALQEARQQKFLDAGSSSYNPTKDAKKISKTYPKDSEFPVDTQVIPYLVRGEEYTQPLKSGEYKLSNVLKVHDLAVSCLALHPQKDVVVTGSDDHLWKMWALPDGNIIMAGEGHTDRLSGCCFHPSGTHLVTSSGDTTVRIWDFSKHGCLLVLEGHTHAVWDCSWHSCGDFVASASMDNTSKIWDVNSERCRYTMCGHKDSVNSIEFLPFSNTVLTSSADKTLSLWDARMGLRVYTFCGHLHSCNHATFNMRVVAWLWRAAMDPSRFCNWSPGSSPACQATTAAKCAALASSTGQGGCFPGLPTEPLASGAEDQHTAERGLHLKVFRGGGKWLDKHSSSGLGFSYLTFAVGIITRDECYSAFRPNKIPSFSLFLLTQCFPQHQESRRFLEK
ncbi:sperm-associated antigen 16 protein isoform X2 [Tyto alba]|uniref:sperm-associated antigen 16 protein isoform X2 n=1 Tax=Tyto alba TaxID=56313 RepID=UPI001C66AC27|nr:sperm-associated antigen 16 protein isoform X2 [Tyto alba]